MERMLVVVFDSEDEAYKGSPALFRSWARTAASPARITAVKQRYNEWLEAGD